MAKKTVPVAPATADENYFVLIRNPLELRRQVLESSKKTINCLQSYQRLILIRHKKQSEIAKLNDLLKELEYLNKKIKGYIPEYKGATIARSAKPEKQSLAPAAIPDRQKKEKTELERLEDSLASIEAQLKNLD